MALDKDEQAVLLLTNRLLLDWISISVDQGLIARSFAEGLIDFSAAEVIKGAPWLADETMSFARVFKDRLPPSDVTGQE
jgi:hypothetical protein